MRQMAAMRLRLLCCREKLFVLLKRNLVGPQIRSGFMKRGIFGFIFTTSQDARHLPSTQSRRYTGYTNALPCTQYAYLTEDFPCFFLSCKANARVMPAKTGHGPHSSYVFVVALCIFCVALCIFLFCSMYCLCCSM
jgi:hypothetical protein